MYDNILLDVSNCYHKAFAVTPGLTAKLDSGQDLSTGGIYTSLKMIQSYERKYLKEGGKIYFLHDNVNSKETYRKEVDPEYKANRESHKDETFYRGLDFLTLILMVFSDNGVVVKLEAYEADDLVEPLLQRIPENETSLLVSSDMDWSRSLSERVHWLKNKDILTPTSFEEQYGFHPTRESVSMWKAFRGDSGDNVPTGVPGIRSKILNQLVQEYRTPQSLIDNLESIEYLNDSWKSKIRENRSRLRLNYELVDYVSIPKKEFQDAIMPCQFKPKTLRKYYELLGFNAPSIDKRMMGMFPEPNKDFFQKQKIERV